MKQFPYSELGQHKLETIEFAIRRWIGEFQYEDVIQWFATHPCTVCVEEQANLFALNEFATEVLYDMAQGRGKWRARREADLSKHLERAFRSGQEIGRAIADGKQVVAIYDGPKRFRSDWLSGIQAVMPPELFAGYSGVELREGVVTVQDLTKH